ncbi:MAG: citramalate synthase [Oscillospiraceae bacterium]|jgi:2-isopropylmalate synthase|nr:citramalate synthase [Oscillospiraceae bacterium]
MKISVLDSTLRDGAQGVDISFSVNDKIAIAKTLDAFGVDYIEAGNPGSNPKDMEFFSLARELDLKNAKLCAFGSTRRKGIPAEQDANLRALLCANTPAVTVFGKASLLHVHEILGVSPEENLRMIDESIRFLKENGKEVIFDAEHFFDGYALDAVYAAAVLSAAAAAGADILCLCDTNGGTLPLGIHETVKRLHKDFPAAFFGIHTHDDIGCAIASSLLAVDAGAAHIQGTFIGFGERCGNADLSGILPTLALKSRNEITGDISQTASAARKIAQIANVSIPAGKPYIGKNAFSHKAGMHIDGVLKNSSSFEHIDPALVGGERRFMLSEVAGRGSILEKIRPYAPHITKDDPLLGEIVAALKELEYQGYQFEGAEAGFELLTKKLLGTAKPHFRLVLYKITGEFPPLEGEFPSTALIKVEVDGQYETTAAQGCGPVHALDSALRKALLVFYPQLAEMKLTDYKVRVLDEKAATAAKVRVLIESADDAGTWTTIGVSDDIIEASLKALMDSIEYKLSKAE